MGVRTVFVIIDVLMEYFPALLGIYVLDRESITPDTVTKRLSNIISVIVKNC